MFRRKKKLPKVLGIVCARCERNEYLLMNIDGVLWTTCKGCGLSIPILLIDAVKYNIDNLDDIKKNMGVQ